MITILSFLVRSSFLSDVEPFRKFEEIYPPEVAEFVYITDDTYTDKQVAYTYDN